MVLEVCKEQKWGHSTDGVTQFCYLTPAEALALKFCDSHTIKTLYLILVGDGQRTEEEVAV